MSANAQLIGELAALIDIDQPSGLAAHALARATISLVANREPRQAILLAEAINALHLQYPRRNYDIPRNVKGTDTLPPIK